MTMIGHGHRGQRYDDSAVDHQERDHQDVEQDPSQGHSGSDESNLFTRAVSLKIRHQAALVTSFAGLPSLRQRQVMDRVGTERRVDREVGGPIEIEIGHDPIVPAPIVFVKSPGNE